MLLLILFISNSVQYFVVLEKHHIYFVKKCPGTMFIFRVQIAGCSVLGMLDIWFGKPESVCHGYTSMRVWFNESNESRSSAERSGHKLQHKQRNQGSIPKDHFER